ncbi:MAG: calcium-binding protein [Pseudomonadota bacterium]
MSFSSTDNILTNGTFDNGLTGWTATDADPTIDSIRVEGSGINMNAGGDTVFGDAIEQSFATAAGQELALVVQLSTFDRSARHDFTVEIFDENGSLIDSLTVRTDAGTGSDFVSFSFTALGATSSVKITNTGTTRTDKSDARVDNVGVFDLATVGAIEQFGDGGSSNRFQGTDADDFMVGGGRQDVFQGSEGADTIDGANGTDTLDYSASTEGVNVFGRGTANEVASTGGLAEGDVIRNIERVIGSEFDDVINVDTNKTTIETLGGDDLIIGAFNFDRLDGGDGDDTIFGGAQNDTLIGGAGNDSLDGETGTDTAVFDGSRGQFDFDIDGDVTLVINRASGEIDRLERIEFLEFDNGTFDINVLRPSEPLNTEFTGDDTAEVINGTGLGDLIVSGAGADTVNGLGGDDTIRAGGGGDDVRGGAGNDSLEGGAGNDSLDGGDGSADVALFAGNRGQFDFDIDGDVTLVINRASGEVDRLENIELLEFDNGTFDINVLRPSDPLNTEFTGDNTAEVINGTGLGDSIISGAGADTVNGLGGDDTIRAGGSGDDVRGGAGNDSLEGGAGNDLLNGAAGNDTLLGGDDRDTLLGGAGDDFLNGGNGVGDMNGGAGDDLIIGGNDRDVIRGADGDDDMRGGGGFDRLIGGNGNDTIDGGSGDDILRGNAGADFFVFFGNFGTDRIDDFNVNRAGEQIGLDNATTGITDFADLVANHLSQQGSDALIDDLDGNTVLLRNVDINDLTADHFEFAVI